MEIVLRLSEMKESIKNSNSADDFQLAKSPVDQVASSFKDQPEMIFSSASSGSTSSTSSGTSDGSSSASHSKLQGISRGGL